MSGRRLPILQGSMGRDIRAWPMLALLLAVVLVSIGCVLWFMREAMQNERLAIRQKLAEAYRGHLALAQKAAEERWNRWLAQLETSNPDDSHFARCVAAGLADSVICFDGDGQVVYPRVAVAIPGQTEAGETLQIELRTLVKAGKTDDAVRFVLENFAQENGASALDAQGRLVAANAELVALELIANPTDSRFQQISKRLSARLTGYTASLLPSPQRTFIMRELQRLDPGLEFPTLAAEDLAARFLEAHPAPLRSATLRTDLRDIWSVTTPNQRVLALLSTGSVRSKLTEFIRDPLLPTGVRITPVAPGDDAATEDTLVTGLAGKDLPGWRLALALPDASLFKTAADQTVTRYFTIGSVVIAAITILSIFVARGFGRQVQLARLKNDLVANVSHELKTPLTAIRALVDTLLETDKFHEQTTREYLQLVATENARLSRLIDNFLTFSRLERNKFSFEFRPVRPERIVEQAVAALGERRHAPGCTLESRVAENLPSINGDPDALVTALLNLLDNACKYTGDVKRIVVRAEAQNGSVRFAVSDNGLGLSARETRRVFARFHQVDRRLSRNAGGCGLGLSIVRSIVEAHRGTVEVTSEVGRGSTFTIEIPASAENTS